LPPGRSAGATRPNVSPAPGLDAADRPSRSGRLASPRRARGPRACAQDAGRGAQAPGLSVAHSGQSHTAKEAPRDGRPFRHQGKKARDAATSDPSTRVRIAWKATGRSGEVSRGGRTRGDTQACEHDLGGPEKDMPGGSVDEASGQLPMTFGSADKTSDCIVDTLDAWGAALEEPAPGAMTRLPSNMENGPERSGRRTPFWPRMGAWCAAMGKPMPRLSSPPSQSKYPPSERCWGIFALHWNGTKWVTVETRGEWAQRRPGKGLHPIGARSRTVDHKGVTLSKKARRAVEARLARHPELPKWDILIYSASI
jgi:Rhodopirellula transposase DDE domain